MVGVFFAGLLVAPGSANAHTALDYANPGDGDSVDEPVSEITVAFTEQVSLVDDGFEVLDPQGNIVVPTVETDDDQVFRLLLDPPLAGGAAGVAYEVTSQDGHVVAGAISFTITAPAPPPTTAPPVTTAAPATTAVSTETTAAAPAVSTSAAPAAPATPATPATTDATVAPETSAVTTVPTSTIGDEEDDGGSGSTWIVLGVAGLVVIGAGAFFVFRRAA